LHTAALARLGSARGDSELSACLETLIDAGVDHAHTEAAGVPSAIAGLGLEITGGDRLREPADAVVVF